MAERPVFIPVKSGSRLVQEILIGFQWHPGMAPSQKKKNVAAIHEAAARRGLSPLLEISSKSEREVGRKLSAFSLKLSTICKETTVESAFQGSTVFERGGPFFDLLSVSSKEAKRYIRLKESGHLIGFRFEGKDYPLSPSTAFYDWLYVNALFPHREWLKRLEQCAGFTDIEFNPKRSLNCQARSCATFVALQKRVILDDAIASFDVLKDLLESAGV